MDVIGEVILVLQPLFFRVLTVPDFFARIFQYILIYQKYLNIQNTC